MQAEAANTVKFELMSSDMLEPLFPRREALDADRTLDFWPPNIDIRRNLQN